MKNFLFYRHHENSNIAAFILVVVVVVAFNPSIDNLEIANNIRQFLKYIIFHEDILKVNI